MYVRMVPAGSGSLNTNLAFYSVLLTYPANSTQIAYVQSGKEFKLPDYYMWTDADGNTYDGGNRCYNR